MKKLYGWMLGTLCKTRRAACICGLGRSAALQILGIASAIPAVAVYPGNGRGASANLQRARQRQSGA